MGRNTTLSPHRILARQPPRWPDGKPWPRLRPVVVGTSTLLVGTVSSAAAFFVGQAVLANRGLQAHLGDPGVARSVLGAGLYLAMLGLLALGIGTLIRSTVGATAVVVGLVFILPGIVGALPSSWEHAVTPYLPSDAGQALMGSRLPDVGDRHRHDHVGTGSAPPRRHAVLRRPRSLRRTDTSRRRPLDHSGHRPRRSTACRGRRSGPDRRARQRSRRPRRS